MKTKIKFILMIMLALSVALPPAFAQKPERAGRGKPEWAGRDAASEEATGRAHEARKRAEEKRGRAEEKARESGKPADRAGKPGEIPPGIEKLKENPPEGWSKGEKEGWEGRDTPPGLFGRFKNFFSGDSKE